jgi:hypothetical protein
MISFLALKAILFILCYRINNPTMSALAEDNRNDVASNIVALVCGLIGNIRYFILYNSYRQNLENQISIIYFYLCVLF